MPDEGYELAQANLAFARQRLDHPRLAGFVERLAHIDALARTSPGFVWRPTADDVAADIDRLIDDPWRTVLNLSVWESIEALRRFTYTGEHLAVLRHGRDWFDRTASQQVLWWTPTGLRPTVCEALAKLAHLREHGPTPRAFTFHQPFRPAPG